MDVVLVGLCSAGYWFCLHFSQRDLLFFYWAIRDPVKASKKEYFIDWKDPSSVRIRLKGHALILLFFAAYFITSWLNRVEPLKDGNAGWTLGGDYLESDSYLALTLHLSSQLLEIWLLGKEMLIQMVWDVIGVAFKMIVLYSGVLLERYAFSKKLFPQIQTSTSAYLWMEQLVGPLSEELVFRKTFLWLLRYRSFPVQILVSSAAFGAAHLPRYLLFLCSDLRRLRRNTTVNHVTDCQDDKESTQSGPRKAEDSDSLDQDDVQQLKRGIRKDMLFGFFLTFVYATVVSVFFLFGVHSRLLPLIVVHEMCNLMSVPNFLFLTHFKERPKTSLFLACCYTAGISVWWNMVSSSFMCM